jgi:broad specificity phosphatase PhoE
MTKIFLLRHGETAWNIEKVFRGRAEVPLTDNGIKQAELAGEHLKGKDIEAIYTSPLERAYETARIVGRKLDLKPDADERLTGFNFGHWQGMPFSRIEKDYPREFGLYKTAPHKFQAPGGETLDEAQKGCIAALKDMEREHSEGTILIVTHRVICKLMLLGILGLGSDRFWELAPDTCSISEFSSGKKGYILKRFNDTSFLKDTERRTEDF